MSRERRAEAVIAAFFDEPQPELPDRVFDMVRGEIHQTRQRMVVGPAQVPDITNFRALFIAAAVVVTVAWITFQPVFGPGSAPANPTRPPTPAPSATPGPSPLALVTGPAAFTSPLYGYRITVPARWTAAGADQRWDGRTQPGFGQADVDNYSGPGGLVMLAFAGPFGGDLQALVDDRIVANARDHADTCPPDALQVNEPFDVGGRAGILLGWNCGALINQVLMVRDGMAYAFSFRDLGIKAARDPTDLAIFRSFLDSVVPPATPRPSR